MGGLPILFDTEIATYIWIRSKNKWHERKGKIQFIDASNICHKLRKAFGKKKNEISPEDRITITKLYADFEESDLSWILRNEAFMYKEYAIIQPL